MDIRRLALKAERLIAENSPAILTAIGVTGTLTTAYLVGRASFKAADIIAAKQFQQNIAERDLEPGHHEFTSREKFEMVWMLYIPAVISAGTTVTCIILANRVGSRRAAVAAAAYSMSERAFQEYREKVHEKFGEAKEREVRDNLAEDRIRRTAPEDRQVFFVGAGETLCHDAHTDRYFMSSMEEIKSAMNKINYTITHDDYATLTDYYNAIGLPKTNNSDDYGWNTDKLLELSFHPILDGENRPVLDVVFATVPWPRPGHFC